MSSSNDVIECLAGAGIVLSGLSWLYWLRQVAREVNKTLPEDKRLDWSLSELGPGWRMHWFWTEHKKLFPESRARAYAMLSISLFFLIGVTAMTFILIADSR
jgi:hypothetical protein